MRHLVLLDPSSHVGAAYLAGNNDGVTTEGLPAIDCSEIDVGHWFATCIRDSGARGGKNQQLLIPASAIAYVVSYAKGEPRPVGFAMHG